MRLLITMIVAAFALAGCTSTRGYWHDIDTGKRADETPALLKRLEVARVICNGESSRVVATATTDAIVASTMADRVFDACMARQGFIVRPE